MITQQRLAAALVVILFTVCAAAAEVAVAEAESESESDAAAATPLEEVVRAVEESMEQLQGVMAWANNVSASLSSSPAWQDCLEMFSEAQDMLSDSLSLLRNVSASSAYVSPQQQQKMKFKDDVQTWLSAALTDEETCLDSLADEDPPGGADPDPAAQKAGSEMPSRVQASETPLRHALALLTNVAA